MFYMNVFYLTNDNNNNKTYKKMHKILKNAYINIAVSGYQIRILVNDVTTHAFMTYLESRIFKIPEKKT